MKGMKYFYFLVQIIFAWKAKKKN